MKKFLTVLFLTLGVVLISGCSLTEQKTVDNTAINEQIASSQLQISGLNAQLEALKTEIEKLKIENENTTVASTTTSTTTPTTMTDNRYRKIYSNKYSVYKKDSITYEICLAGNKDVCINLFQYNGKFNDYYKTLMPKEDRDNLPSGRQPMIVSTIEGRKEWKCSIYIETNICFNENLNGSLVMIISDQRGEGFHGGEYDPREILKVIDL